MSLVPGYIKDKGLTPELAIVLLLMVAVILTGLASVTVQGLVDESKKAVDDPNDRPGLADEFLVLNIDSEGNPSVDDEIKIIGEFESSSTLINYKLYRNGNMIDDGSLSGSQDSVEKPESPGEGVFNYKYEVLDTEMRKNSSTLTIDNTTTTLTPAGLQETGGPEDGTITSIETPSDPGLFYDAVYTTSDSMCFGDGCSSNEADQGSVYDNDNFVNQTGDGMTGSLYVGTLSVKSDGDMCIGSECQFGQIVPSGGSLSDSNTETGTGFVLETETVKPLNDEIRLE